MDIIELPVKAIKPYAKNPRKNDKAVEYVANSIRQFGFKVPIVIDSNYEIVCGHTRWKAAKTIGLESVPCVMADDLTPEQVKAFRLADNKTAEMAGWDFDLLEQEFNDIDPELFDMSDFGFFADDAQNFIDDLLNNDLASPLGSGDAGVFAVTLVFPISEKEKITEFIRKSGKQPLVDAITREVDK
jgi:ParB family transcriptional regulator, chromosome partitioning protein